MVGDDLNGLTYLTQVGLGLHINKGGECMSDFLSNLRNFLLVDARRKSGEPGLVNEDRYNEGRLIGDILPPGIGAGAAGLAGLGYELGAKPALKYLPQSLSQYLPEEFQYKPGISSEPEFLEGIKRAGIAGLGALESGLGF